MELVIFHLGARLPGALQEPHRRVSTSGSCTPAGSWAHALPPPAAEDRDRDNQQAQPHQHQQAHQRLDDREQQGAGVGAGAEGTAEAAAESEAESESNGTERDEPCPGRRQRRRVVGAPLQRPPPGWDDLAGARRAVGLKRGAVAAELGLATWRRPAHVLARLAVLFGGCWPRCWGSCCRAPPCADHRPRPLPPPPHAAAPPPRSRGLRRWPRPVPRRERVAPGALGRRFPSAPRGPMGQVAASAAPVGLCDARGVRGALAGPDSPHDRHALRGLARNTHRRLAELRHRSALGRQRQRRRRWRR